MSFVNRYVGEILKLHVSLYQARARLEADTDADALHALRISVRRIRSLLAPVRILPAWRHCEPLPLMSVA